MSRYRYNCESLLHFESLREQGLIDETHFLEINYEDLRDNLELTMKKIIKFTGIKTSAKLRSKWAELARRQSSYQRKHTNLSLDDLGLSEQKVRHDLAPIFVKYGG